MAELQKAILEILNARAPDEPFYEYYLCEIFVRLSKRAPNLTKKALLEAMATLISDGLAEQSIAVIAEGKTTIVYGLLTGPDEQAFAPKGMTQRLIEAACLEHGIPIHYRSCACDTEIIRSFVGFHTGDRSIERIVSALNHSRRTKNSR
ncbi:hypothetical protein KW791_01210 [Candidatus Parcubacteria bacterium]|nr:hypothetical protein [Candidatus Parcubacteria bacterium]